MDKPKPLKMVLNAGEITAIDDAARRLASMSAQLSRITGFDPGEDPRDAIIKELMEALERTESKLTDICNLRTQVSTIADARTAARSALSRAKSLMEQKP